MRWLWGFPVPLLLVQGDKPLLGYWDWEAFELGPWYFRLFVDLLFWVLIFLGAALMSTWVTRKAHTKFAGVLPLLDWLDSLRLSMDSFVHRFGIHSFSVYLSTNPNKSLLGTLLRSAPKSPRGTR